MKHVAAISLVDGKYMIYLASKSPRRKQLLTSAGIPFEVVNRDSVGLPAFDKANPGEYARELAVRKALAAKCPSDKLVLGCDTIVVLDGELLEKPPTERDAVEYLLRLQNNWHDVFTGIALWDKARDILYSDVEQTGVHFAPLTIEDIEAYVRTGEPMDKAGAYGIQEKGALLVREIRGDYFNVVGLPLFRLTLLLEKFNIKVRELIVRG